LLTFVALVLTAALAHASWSVLLRLLGEVVAWRSLLGGIG
jgi:hypothetical protein